MKREFVRNGFEKWASDRGWPLRRCADGSYANCNTNDAWLGWEASLKELARNPACPIESCGLPLSGNGLICWCDNAHIYSCALDVDECGLVFTEEERRVIAAISEKQELRPAAVIKRALATYQLLASGTHDLREVSPSLKLPSDEFLASLKHKPSVSEYDVHLATDDDSLY
jgi:hypothetical protein